MTTTRTGSPIRAVARSVVMGAAMISPALLESCSHNNQPPPRPPPPPDGTAGDAGVAAADAAPPTVVVRPRPNPNTPNGAMPTRGFAGGRRFVTALGQK